MKITNLWRKFSEARKAKNSMLGFSPQRMDSPTYAERFEAKWHRVYKQSSGRYPPPTYYGSIAADLQEKLDEEFPESGVLEIKDAFLYGVHGRIFSKEPYFLSDHSWFGRHVEEIKEPPKRLTKDKHLDGVCLSLASEAAGRNYGHFLLDSLSRLHLFNEAGFKLSDVDRIFCHRPPSKSADRFFDQLNIPREKCVWANENAGQVVHVEKLIAPTFPGARRHYPIWVPTFLKQELLPSPPEPNRRLYISRSGCRRNAVNEKSIHAILVKYNFEIYDPAQHENPAYDFAESKIVVGPHGGGLTDLAFCQPDTKVLELVPTDHVYPYYYTLSNAARLDYGCLLCHSTEEREKNAFGPSFSDFYVDEQELDDALSKIVSMVYGIRDF